MLLSMPLRHHLSLSLLLLLLPLPMLPLPLPPLLPLLMLAQAAMLLLQSHSWLKVGGCMG